MRKRIKKYVRAGKIRRFPQPPQPTQLTFPMWFWYDSQAWELAIAKEFKTPVLYDEIKARVEQKLFEQEMEWCKQGIQKKIDEDNLQHRVDWDMLKIERKEIAPCTYIIECRLPLL